MIATHNYGHSGSRPSSVSVLDSMPQLRWTVATLLCAILLPVAYRLSFWLIFPGYYPMSSNEGTFRCFAEQNCSVHSLDCIVFTACTAASKVSLDLLPDKSGITAYLIVTLVAQRCLFVLQLRFLKWTIYTF